MTDVLANAAITMEGDEDLHPLENTWCVWVNIVGGNRKSAKDNWGDKQLMVHEFDTVEDFWCLYNNINTQQWHGDLAFFKKGITPAWEDATCKHGGRWVLKLDMKNRADADSSTWLNLVLALIGEESFEGADNDLVCGAVLSSRAKGPTKVALWLKTTSKSAVMRLGETFARGIRASIGNGPGGTLGFEHFEKKAYTMHTSF